MRLPSRFVGLTAAFLTCAGALVGGTSACGEEDATVRPRLNGTGDGGVVVDGALGCGVAVPETYVAPNFAINAAAEVAFGANLDALDQKMASTEGPATATASAVDLAALYNAGTPSLRTVSTSASQTLVDAYLTAFGAAQGKTWQPSDAQADGGAATGGKFQGLFYESAKGVDLRAATTKSILAGALYNAALSVVLQGITDASVDKLLALFGATTAFANTTAVDNANADRHVAALASKRDDKTKPTGIYRRVRTALLTMKAAAGNPACQADLDAAVAAYFLGWEQATYASAIFSLNAAASTALTPESAALTLHSYGDALGLIQSFKGIPAEKRKISDAQIEFILGQIHADAPFTTVTDAGTRKIDLTSALNSIAGIYEFDALTVESFKQNL